MGPCLKNKNGGRGEDKKDDKEESREGGGTWGKKGINWGVRVWGWNGGMRETNENRE